MKISYKNVICVELEENLAGCQDIIDNFLLKENVRLAEEDEKRRKRASMRSVASWR
jgi:hypothetical protein